MLELPADLQSMYQVGYGSPYKPAQLCQLSCLIGVMALDFEFPSKTHKDDWTNEQRDLTTFTTTLIDDGGPVLTIRNWGIDQILSRLAFPYKRWIRDKELKRLYQQGFKPLLEKAGYGRRISYLERSGRLSLQEVGN